MYTEVYMLVIYLLTRFLHFSLSLYIYICMYIINPSVSVLCFLSDAKSSHLGLALHNGVCWPLAITSVSQRT